LSPNNIFIVTRDISYPGGTEIFLSDYLKYLANNTSRTSTINLLEVDGSNKFENKTIYRELKNIGIEILKIPLDIARLEPWDRNKISYINQIFSKKNPRTIHSFLFNADFIAFYFKVGKKVAQKSLSQYKREKFFEIYPDAFNRLPKIASMEFIWISSKFNNFSVAMEQSSNEWKIRKDFIDTKLEPIISRHANINTAVSTEIAQKWEPWSNYPPIVIPCTAIGKKDLLKIDELISNSAQFVKSQTKMVKYVCVSRLVPGKGLEDIVEAFDKSLKSLPNIELTIVGGGELSDSLISKASHIPQIKIVGYTPRVKVWHILAESDVFVFGSYSEGLPLSIQEAMAFRLPVITTNVGGIPNLVCDLQNGILYNPGDIFTLSRNIIKLGKSSKLRQEMGLISREKLESNFLKDTSYNSLYKLYN